MRRPSTSHIAHHRADDHGDAELAHRALDPAAERDLVVVDDRRVRAVAVIELLAVLAERLHDVVGDAVGELVAVRAVGEEAAERADDRIHRLPAQRRHAVDQDHLAPEPGRLDRRGGAGGAGADDADVAFDLAHRALARPADDPGAFRFRHAPSPVFVLGAMLVRVEMGEKAASVTNSFLETRKAAKLLGTRIVPRPDRSMPDCRRNAGQLSFLDWRKACELHF